ncbi:MAG: hypothetical protein FWG69_00345, partial [Oscillospiraceae bacterium]|nr:hypothetical protein [Oscillospiraceae bacterium]
MCEKDLNELFDKVEIIPCEEAKRNAKARMLEAAEKQKTNFLRRSIMEGKERVEETTKKVKEKFRITKHHWQGAVAMLLICTITVSALALAPGINLFGTMFKGHEKAEEITLTADPMIIEARADYAGETFTLSGQLPKDDIAVVKPEHIFLGGYFEGMSVKKLEAAKDGLKVTLSSAPAKKADEDAVDWQDMSDWDGGMIAITPAAFEGDYFYQANINVIYPEAETDLMFVDFAPNETINEKVKLSLMYDSF